MKLIIRIETPQDFREVENLTREAFWNVYRPGCVEHCVLHCFRQRPEFVPELSLVAELEGRVVAHIMYCRAEIVRDDGGTLPIMTFGPVSVLPEMQKNGYGTALITESLRRAELLGCGAVVITGNPVYYKRFGFTDARSKCVYYAAFPREEQTPFFMVKELRDGFLHGITGSYTDPDGYLIDDETAERFDADFEPKEKLVLDGQLS